MLRPKKPNLRIVSDREITVVPTAEAVVIKTLAEKDTDPLVTVIVLATYAEYVMTELLRRAVEKRNHIDGKSSGFGYRDLLKLLLAMNELPEDLGNILRELSTMRNRFAHEITYMLPDSDVLRFANAWEATRADKSMTIDQVFHNATFTLSMELMRLLHAPTMQPVDFLDKVIHELQDLH